MIRLIARAAAEGHFKRMLHLPGGSQRWPENVSPGSLLTNVRIQNNVTSQGIFALAIETNLGLLGNALYGYDTVALSYPGSNTPSLNQQVVGGIATKDFYMGLFGLNPAASNFSTYNDPQQSYMSSLKSQNLIPSLSYGYTAGNTYRFNGALGSLTIGGFDASLFEPNEYVYFWGIISFHDISPPHSMFCLD